jgi:hypothetical protein
MATFTADATGHIAIGVERGELHAIVRANALDGKPFAPGETVEIDDARLAAILDELLAPFGAAGVPIDEHRQPPDPHRDDPALPGGR